ncbi:MAG: hypothetical protein M5U09_24200 [Gammaproteobacteria bacterium]|nr:hypothetical protein [Gammaproteobacteria bacterium]
MQLIFIVTMGVLYAVSPKAFSEDTMFAPVPWAIVLYLTFTLMRLVLAHRRTLPRALLVFSVVLDMTLLMGLIFSFHLQYEQPPSFYLKAPTILYVFIFIAIRALRFDPLYVILSGLAAALGWLLLAAYALALAPHEASVTRDYAEYLTSNRILIGAELDKIISIAIVTTVLAIGIARARDTLVRSVAEQSAVSDLSRFLPRRWWIACAPPPLAWKPAIARPTRQPSSTSTSSRSPASVNSSSPTRWWPRSTTISPPWPIPSTGTAASSASSRATPSSPASTFPTPTRRTPRAPLPPRARSWS